MNIEFPHAGEVYSLASAILWAISVILFKLSGEKVQPVPLNLFKCVVGLFLILVTMLLADFDLAPASNTGLDWLVLLVSGILGIGLADTAFFASLNRIGAGRFAIVDCLYSPFILLCSFIYLREPIGPSLLLALALLIGAVFIGTWTRSANRPVKTKNIAIGVFLGILATFLMAASLVMAKPVLDRSDPFWATMVRLVGGTSLLLVQGTTKRHRAEVARCFIPGPVWKLILPTAIVGTYLAMFFWIAGMTYTHTTTASVLNQTSIIFVILLATFILREPLSARKIVAVLLGVSGGMLALF